MRGLLGGGGVSSAGWVLAAQTRSSLTLSSGTWPSLHNGTYLYMHQKTWVWEIIGDVGLEPRKLVGPVC